MHFVALDVLVTVIYKSEALSPVGNEKLILEC